MQTVRYGLLALLLNLIFLSCDKPILVMQNITPTVLSPLPGQIFQRDNSNTAFVPIDVQAPSGIVYATFEPIQGGKAVSNVKIGTLVDGRVKGAVAVTGGDYKLTITVQDAGTEVGNAVVDRVGVGEVIVVWGHSVAQGVETQVYNNPDPRVRCIDYYDPDCVEANLPFRFSPVSATTRIGPFGIGPYAWGPFGNKLAASLNVPVLLFNTAFGGSTIERNDMVIRGIPFSEPSFIKFDKGMPYQPLKATLSKYVPKTGVRAILVHHGANDRFNALDDYKNAFKRVIDHTRSTFNLPTLPILLAMEDGGPNVDVTNIRNATTQLLQSEKNLYLGADLAAMHAKRAGREDVIHLQTGDWEDYATLWANALLPLIQTTKPVLAQLASDTPVVNGSLLKLDTVKQYLPDAQSALLAVSIGAVVALFVAKKPIPALIALCLAMFGLGRKVEKKLLNAKQITQVG